MEHIMCKLFNCAYKLPVTGTIYDIHHKYNNNRNINSCILGMFQKTQLNNLHMPILGTFFNRPAMPEVAGSLQCYGDTNENNNHPYIILLSKVVGELRSPNDILTVVRQVFNSAKNIPFNFGFKRFYV